MLSEVRQRLELVMAIAYIASTALKSPHAASDAGVALALQRCIGDEIGRQLEDIGWVARRLTDKPAGSPRGSWTLRGSSAKEHLATRRPRPAGKERERKPSSAQRE
jgi:hypothetical protein